VKLPASQLVSRWSNSGAYAFNGCVNVDCPYATDGLDQYSSAGPATFAFDMNGNLTSDGAATFLYDILYDIENRMVIATGTRRATLISACAAPGSRSAGPLVAGRSGQCCDDGRLDDAALPRLALRRPALPCHARRQPCRCLCAKADRSAFRHLTCWPSLLTAHRGWHISRLGAFCS